MGVIAGVHHGAAHSGPPAHVALAAGLAQVHVLVIHVADLADGGHAAGGHVAQLSGGEADQGVFALFGHQLGGVAGGAHQLGALAGVELDVVDDGAVGDVLQGQSLSLIHISSVQTSRVSLS